MRNTSMGMNNRADFEITYRAITCLSVDVKFPPHAGSVFRGVEHNDVTSGLRRITHMHNDQ